MRYRQPFNDAIAAEYVAGLGLHSFAYVADYIWS